MGRVHEEGIVAMEQSRKVKNVMGAVTVILLVKKQAPVVMVP